MTQEIDEIHLYGMWNERGKDPIAAPMSDDGKAAIAFIRGETDDCPPHIALIVRDMLRAQDDFRERLLTNLRRAAADMQKLAQDEVGPLGLPSDLGEAVRQQHNIARYEVAMYGAQRVHDAVNKTLGES